jgi:hypothetical protein
MSNTIEYKTAGDITLQDALKLIQEAKALKKSTLAWLKKQYPQYT